MSDAAHLAEMLAAAERIQSYTAGLDEPDFLANGLTADAVSLNLLVIGESANRLAAETRAKAEDIPWIDVINLRHRIAHGYARIDLRIVWRIVQDDLPLLLKRLERLSEPR